MFDLNHSFFRPLWLRVLIVAIALGWSLVELTTDSPGWAIMFGAVGIYAARSFFINFKPLEDDQAEVKDDLSSSENKDENNG